MPSAFRRVQERYGGSAPVETPYQRAGQVWDDRLGSKVVEAARWRLMAFISVGLAALALGAYIYERQDTHIATYVVPVDRAGRPGRIELADRVYAPTRAEQGRFVSDFVSLARVRSTDAVIVTDNWTKALQRVGGEARATLLQYQQANDAAARLGARPVTVRIISVLPRTKDTYQVQWQETAYEQGVAQRPEVWTGLFTLAHRQPRTEERLLASPLGLTITSFQWSVES